MPGLWVSQGSWFIAAAFLLLLSLNPYFHIHEMSVLLDTLWRKRGHLRREGQTSQVSVIIMGGGSFRMCHQVTPPVYFIYGFGRDYLYSRPLLPLEFRALGIRENSNSRSRKLGPSLHSGQTKKTKRNYKHWHIIRLWHFSFNLNM